MTERRRSSRSRGFSIIELMFIVAIVGLLASIAMPMYLHQTKKAKLSERDNMINGIEQSMIEYIAKSNQLPNAVGTDSFFFGGWNPPWPPSPQPRTFVVSQDDWRQLLFRPTRSLYNSYYVFAFMGSTGVYFEVFGAADLDGNGLCAYRHRRWELINGAFDVTIDDSFGDI